MRYLLILSVLFLTSCAYNETTIMAQGNVYCTASVDKPVSVTPSVQADGNTVPLMP